MPDYKAMYIRLLGAQFTAIEALERAVQETDAMAIEEQEPLLLAKAPPAKAEDKAK